MKIFTPFILVFFLLAPLFVKGTIQIGITSPEANRRYDGKIDISVNVSSTSALDSVAATVGDSTIILVHQGGNTYSGSLLLKDFPNGNLLLKAYARNMQGESATATRTFIYDAFPTVHVEAPAYYASFNTKIHIKASVSDIAQVNCKGNVRSKPASFSLNFVNSIDTVVDVFPKDTAAQFQLIFSAVDSALQVTAEALTMSCDKSKSLSHYFTGTGLILDFKKDRALMMTGKELDPKFFHITNIADSTTADINFDAVEGSTGNAYAKLCPGGAAFLVIYYDSASNSEKGHLCLWENGILTNISKPLGITAYLTDIQCEGDYVMWLTENLRVAVTNVVTKVTTFSGGSRVININNDLTADGTAVYSAMAGGNERYQIFKYSAVTQITTQITPGEVNIYPSTDGNNIVYLRRQYGQTGPFNIRFYDGVTDSIISQQAEATGYKAYRLKEGYVLFEKPDQQGKLQVLLRRPDGTNVRLSPFLTDSRVDRLGNKGRAMFFNYNNLRRYYADSLTGTKPISGPYGTTYFLDSTFYLVLGGSAYKFNTAYVANPPVITSFTPDTAATGQTVTIKGKSFIEITDVTFGGTPAASYTVTGDTIINAVVGAGKTGAVEVTTSGGRSTVPGFVYIPPPSITAISAASAMTGTVIYITGIALNDATSVTFGGVPAASFTVQSQNRIAAVVGNGASGDIVVTTPGGIATKNGFTFVFSLPASNFKLTNTGVSCKGATDGTINITAVQHLSYTATITGNDLDSSFAFTLPVTMTNLAAGIYDICITVAGQPGYQQCFSSMIGEPEDLSVYIAMNQNGSEAILSMTGAEAYHLTVNGVSTTTENAQVTLHLKNGLNSISVRTDKPCQGTFIKEIMVDNGMTVYPNPFRNTVYLNLGANVVQDALITMFNADGKLVYSRRYTNQSGNISIPLSDVNDGIYVLKLLADKRETIFKLLKK